MTTAQEVYDAALVLIDSPEDLESTTADYYEKAPYLIDMLQRDLALKEGIDITEKITALTDELEISDDTALRVMPYGLAAKFALHDKDPDLYNDYSMQYMALQRTIPRDEEDVEDQYDSLDGMQL